MEQYELVEGGIKAWFAVSTCVDNEGRIYSAITDTIYAIRKPESVYRALRRKDVYIDYYESREEAEKAVKEAMA